MERAPWSELVGCLVKDETLYSQLTSCTVHIQHIIMDVYVHGGRDQCPTSEDRNDVDLNHEKGQQAMNDSCTGGGVVFEAHSGHQVYEKRIAASPELSMLSDSNPDHRTEK